MRTTIRPFLTIAAISGVLLGIVVFLHLWKNIPIGRLTGDPVDIGGNMPVYSGFLSQVGIFFWAAAASVCFFCASVLDRRRSDARLSRFLLVSGGFTVLLALDDLFLLHEIVFPYFGIHQNIVLGGYMAFTLGYLFAFRQTILQTEFLVLILALSMFAISVGLDVFKPFKYLLTFSEDGAKLIGVVSWAVYFSSVGRQALGSSTSAAPQS